MRINKLNASLFAIALFAILFSGCKDDDDNASVEAESLNGKSMVIFNPDSTYGEMIDQDGNTYKTISIGTQTWMAENLRTTKYRNGVAIPNVTNNLSWNPLTTGAYCNYDNTTDLSTIATYGRLYNWFAVSDSSNLAPVGWHVATDAEWDTLTTFLGGIALAGAEMKETGTSHWKTSDFVATNLSGFSATPGGYRNFYDGLFYQKGYYSYFWSSTENDATYAYYHYLNYNDTSCKRMYLNKLIGCSVRCVKN